jgi:hypothetical protein
LCSHVVHCEPHRTNLQDFPPLVVVKIARFFVFAAEYPLKRGPSQRKSRAPFDMPRTKQQGLEVSPQPVWRGKAINRPDAGRSKPLVRI